MNTDVLLITGGSRGIGAATAKLATIAGYRVLINYVSNAAAAEALVSEINQTGGSAQSIAGDVSSEQDVIAMFDLAETMGPLAGLVNNAGVLEQQMPLQQMTVDRWRRVLDVNVIGTMLCAREAIRRWSVQTVAQDNRSIVNVSSIAASLGSPGEYVDYAASKGAVDSLTRGLAIEVASMGVRVNAVRPGVIKTDIHATGGEPERVSRVAKSLPMRRGGETEEVAQAILWLLSKEASYITGTSIDVSGGR